MENPVKEIPHIVHGLTTSSLAHQSHILNAYFLPDAAFDHPLCQVDSFLTYDFWIIGRLESRTFIRGIYRWYKLLSHDIKLQINSIAFDDKFSDYLYATGENDGSGRNSGWLVREIAKDRPMVGSSSQEREGGNYIHRYSRLYCDITQVFTCWFFPWYHIKVGLVVVLFLEGRLVEEGGEIEESTDRAFNLTGESNVKKNMGINGLKVKKKYWIAKQVDLFPIDELGTLLPGMSILVRILKRLSTLLCFLGSLFGYLMRSYKDPNPETCPSCRDTEKGLNLWTWTSRGGGVEQGNEEQTKYFLSTSGSEDD